jgi:hypothetical protein
LEHWAKLQKVKELLQYYTDGPQADIITMLIEFARLFDFRASPAPLRSAIARPQRRWLIPEAVTRHFMYSATKP